MNTIRTNLKDLLESKIYLFDLGAFVERFLYQIRLTLTVKYMLQKLEPEMYNTKLSFGQLKLSKE